MNVKAICVQDTGWFSEAGFRGKTEVELPPFSFYLLCTMDRKEIAEVSEEIGTLLEMNNQNKSQASIQVGLALFLCQPLEFTAVQLGPLLVERKIPPPSPPTKISPVDLMAIQVTNPS